MPDQPDYRVEVRDSAAREIRGLPSDVKKRMIEAVDRLSIDPRPRGSLKLKGGSNLYRIRVGVYRLVYQIDDNARFVTITRARHRRDVYS